MLLGAPHPDIFLYSGGKDNWLNDVFYLKKKRHGVQEIGDQHERDEGNFQGDDARRSQYDGLKQA